MARKIEGGLKIFDPTAPSIEVSVQFPYPDEQKFNTEWSQEN
jgi:hypothetical protein